MRGTRAMQMVLGILILFGSASLLVQLYPLTTLKWVIDKFYSSIIIIIVILFQEDIRQMLSRVGKKSFLGSSENISSQYLLDEITRAAAALAQARIGALVVIERNIILNRYIDVGTLLEAKISKELLLAVFNPESPIHDGAVIIQQGRVAAAGCFLPLTRDTDIDSNFGTRHRAAIGISQETDAVVIAVSEERGTISLVIDGKVSRNLDPKELRKALRSLLSQSAEQAQGDHAKLARKRSWAILERMRIFRSGRSK
jgi:diadenylate cyclase